MSKGINNLYDFNISCKACNGKNITAREIDGYIDLICIDCETLDKYNKEIENISNYNMKNSFIENLLLNKDTERLKETLNEVLSDSKKALEIYLKIAKILEEDYNKDNINGGFVYNNSLFKDEIFALCESLKGLKILDYVYTSETLTDVLILCIVLYNEPIYIEQFDSYELGCNSYELDFKVSSKTYTSEIRDMSDLPCDTILMGNEIGGKTDCLKRYIEKIEKYLKDI